MNNYLLKPVNIFILIILIGFALILFWLGNQRYSEFVQANILSANNAANIAGKNIEKFIQNRQRFIEIFLDDNYDEILTLSEQPDNEKLHQKLSTKLHRFFPEHFTINIATTEGVPIIDDFDNKLGDVCIADMKKFAKNNIKTIRVHPNYHLYHFDIIVKFSSGDTQKLLFTSFGLDNLARILKTAQPKQHQLLLVSADTHRLIEINDQGGRDTINDRQDYRFTQNETSRILATSHVNGTSWDIVDLYQTGLIDSYINTLLEQGLIIYTIFTAVLLLMKRYLSKEEQKRNVVENNLLKRNKEIEELNRKLLDSNNELERLSTTDALTGLSNRGYFDNWIHKEWNRAIRNQSSISLAIIDVDYFKQYNDVYGHLKGDRCLKFIADTMTACFKRSNEFVARYGGEEFVIVLTGTDKQNTINALTQLKDAIEDSKIEHQGSNIQPYVTISVGIAHTVPQQSDSLQQFINSADKMLYNAKSAGRNQIMCL